MCHVLSPCLWAAVHHRPATSGYERTAVSQAPSMWQAPPWVRAQMAKDMAAGRWRGQAKPDTAEANGKDGKKPVPKPYMSAELREDSMHTTGVSSLPSDLVAPACLIACGRGSPSTASHELMLQVCAGDACKGNKGKQTLLMGCQSSAHSQRYCPGAASRSFTSTAVNVVTKNERKMIRVERHPKAKAYLRLHTSLGYV